MNAPVTTQTSTRDGLPWFNAFTAAFIAVLVGVTSSIALVFAAAKAAGATPAQTGSWIGALCIGKGISAIILSVRYRTPILLAWSTPGAALLATGLTGVTMGQAIGAFMLCGLLLLATGLTGIFDRVISRIPLPLASALLAGVLARFAVDSFASAKTDTLLIVSMFATYLVSRLFVAKFSALCVLGTGIAVSAAQGSLHTGGVRLGLVHPSFVRPSFDIGVLLGLGIPLYIVTMAAQNVPGVAALRAHGYDVPASPAITASGIATTLLSPFGMFGINLAAITASMVMGPDIHEDRAKRYPAAAMAGGLYIGIGLIGGSIASVLGVLPKPMIIAVAGFALLPTIGGGLTTAVSDPTQRDAAIVTFLITLSGLTMANIGAAFWAIVAGTIVLLLPHIRTGLGRRTPWKRS
jgi:benzoate membrane transport protein